MNLLYTVKQLADARAATRPAPQRRRISLRERTAQAMAAEEARLHEEQLLCARYPVPTHAVLTDLRRRRPHKLTRQELDDACFAVLDTWSEGEESETDTEVEDEIDEKADRLDAQVARLRRRHGDKTAAAEQSKRGAVRVQEGRAGAVLEDDDEGVGE
ncbi:hypothetical protein PWT90_10904 [Aphanocladium album]|nr:hypothetical protein PWT90_10904 [Aphanocladium album]